MKNKSLSYHSQPKAGKISVNVTKPTKTAEDLSLAYSPGVAYPCLEIKENKETAYTYTTKGNLVGVISNGTAVLGLGNIGALAGKPVMEGKGVLFKRFAGIDVFDIEINEENPTKFIDIVASLEPTFGGINLEDIKAPECFIIEEELKKRLDIPVFHDDQHGTAIITAAALKNALKLTEKKISDIKIVMNGAGAASIAIAKLLLDIGVNKTQIHMFDSKGLLYQGRDNLNKYKEDFTQKKESTLIESMKNADVFIGVSVGNLLNKEMIQNMNPKPIIFAMANPTPEITPELAKSVRPDAIIATGRSDYPNQVNNVLGFPFIFRAALDVRAKEINKEMKLAAVDALALLAQEKVDPTIEKAYGEKFEFGPNYIIPKPFDPRLLTYVTPIIAKAAINSKAARKNINIENYSKNLKEMHNKL